MEPTLEEFRDVFSEFSTISDGRINYFMNQAKKEISEAYFLESYSHAVYLVTAHTLIINDPSRAGKGTVTSESAGDLSVGYNANTAVEEKNLYYSQTQYGMQFLQLQKSCIITMNVI